MFNNVYCLAGMLEHVLFAFQLRAVASMVGFESDILHLGARFTRPRPCLTRVEERVEGAICVDPG